MTENRIREGAEDEGIQVAPVMDCGRVHDADFMQRLRQEPAGIKDSVRFRKSGAGSHTG